MDYGGDFTRKSCSTWSESTFLLLKPEGIPETGLVLTQIQEAGFKLARAKLVQLNRHQEGVNIYSKWSVYFRYLKSIKKYLQNIHTPYQAEYVYRNFNLHPEFNNFGEEDKS